MSRPCKGDFNWPYSGILNIKWNKIYKLVVLVFIVFQYLLGPVHIISRHFLIGHFLFFVVVADSKNILSSLDTKFSSLDNKLLLSYYILLHWKLKRSAEFSPKVPIQPCRPKSDSASPLAISAQFKPKQPQRLFQPTLGSISAIRSNSTLGNWTVLPLI